MTDRELLDFAKEAQLNSYAPYSKFNVGAALLCEDGTVYKGSNIENSSFSATVCAERTAIFKAVSDGHKKFVAMAIYGEKNPCLPCGVCRQVAAEFCGDNFKIITVKNGEIITHILGELLPEKFNL